MIRCGLPSANKAADDRAPRLDEIQRVLEDSDPRVKPILLAPVEFEQSLHGIRNACSLLSGLGSMQDNED